MTTDTENYCKKITAETENKCSQMIADAEKKSELLKRFTKNKLNRLIRIATT